MAEATKKSTQGTGSTGGRGKGTGATDPNPETANLGGGSSSVTTSGTGSATSSGTTGASTSGGIGGSMSGSAGSGSTGGSGLGSGTGSSSGGGSSMGSTGSSTRTSGTHDMGVSASQQSEGSGLMDQMRSSASDTFKTVKSNTTAKLEEQKSALSSGLSTVADNIRQLGSNLSGAQANDPLTRFAADYSETAAAKLRSAANYFESHDIETMYRDVEGLARRNPAVFVGGAFAIGFLAARFLKSSSPSGGRNYGSTGSRDLTSGSTTPRLNAGGTSNATAI